MAPDGWRWLTIGELGHGSVDVVQTGPFGAQLHAKDYVSDGVPFVLIKNMTDTGIDTTDMPRISIDDASRLEKYSLRAGDIVFSRVGRVGSCFLATVDHEGWIISGQLLRIRLPEAAIHPPFLVWALRGDSAQDFIHGSAVGSTRKSINTKILFSLQVPVPPLIEQCTIAAILSSVDDAIEKTQAVIDQVQVVKRGLVQELLTRGMPGRHTRFKQTVIGEIPIEWELLSLAELAETPNGIQTGPFGSQLHASEYVESGVPVIMPKDLVDGRVSAAEAARITEHKVNELARHRVQAGDILFARRGDVGRAGLVMHGQEGWICGTGCFRFRPKSAEISGFLRHWVDWPFSARWLTEHAVGQTMLNLNSAILGRLPVALPSEDERAQLGGVLDAPTEQMQALKHKLRGLEAVKRSLMFVLLTGDVRVTPGSEFI